MTIQDSESLTNDVQTDLRAVHQGRCCKHGYHSISPVCSCLITDLVDAGGKLRQPCPDPQDMEQCGRLRALSASMHHQPAHIRNVTSALMSC